MKDEAYIFLNLLFHHSVNRKKIVNIQNVFYKVIPFLINE